MWQLLARKFNMAFANTKATERTKECPGKMRLTRRFIDPESAYLQVPVYWRMHWWMNIHTKCTVIIPVPRWKHDVAENSDKSWAEKSGDTVIE
jgi:hypothetical protein